MTCLHSSPRCRAERGHRSRTERDRDDRGIIALVTLVIIGALILTIGLSASLIGQSHIAVTGETDRARSARELAAACVSEALFRLKKNEAYVGGTVPSAFGDCTVSVSGAGATRTIVAAASDVDLTQQVTVTATERLNGSGKAKAWEVMTWREGL